MRSVREVLARVKRCWKMHGAASSDVQNNKILEFSGMQLKLFVRFT
jgi:hypothetical protein